MGFIKFHFLYIFIIIFLLNKSLLQDCPRDKPILKSNICQSIYCTQEEYSQGICTISNDIIKIQWLNNFHTFDKLYMSHISVTQNSNGDLFLSSQKIVDDFDKYMFGFDSEGEGLFYDKEKDKYTSFQVIDFPVREYADYNNYIEIDGKGYLIGVPTDDDIYLIDYINNTIKSFTIKPAAFTSDTIFKIHNSNNLFFTAYIFCKDTFGKNCSLHFQLFNLNLTKLEKVKNITNIPAYKGTRIKCFQNSYSDILCFYCKKVGENIIDEYETIPLLEYYVSVINPITFEFEDSLCIENNFAAERMFDDILHLKEDLYIIAYAIDDEVIKVQFKNILINSNLDKNSLIYEDFFWDIKEIYINKDRQFDLDHGSYKRNSLCKINDNKFAMFLKDYTKDSFKVSNSIVIIYIFTIYNKSKNLNIRRYSIDFELYNKHATDDIRGYTLANFFGVILGLTKDIDSSQSAAAFLTFGYVNTTEQESIDTKLKYNNTNSKIIISNYINKIENNLFGYDFIGVKIISLPSEGDAGIFINSINNQKIKIKETISRNSELQFILSKFFKDGIYSIEFAGLVREPSYEKMNEIAEEIISYPQNNNISEKEFYEPKIFAGKKINYRFSLSACYESCSTCEEFSEDENDHKCLSCKEGFYFLDGTKNCYDKIDTKYYLDENTKKFLPCYKDCLTCSTKEENELNMNCLTCENDLNFYNKSKNCMKCPKYINFEQNECIETIPDGYYLDNKALGTIRECYYLCETCKGGLYIINSIFYMNCLTCLYTNSKYKKTNEGDCPNSPESVVPDDPEGDCPIDKPILKDGECQLIYCTAEEFLNNMCKINNPIIKTQWLNKFNIFSESNTNSVSIANDIISNEKIIFMAQNIDKSNEYLDKYFCGFFNNGTGLFYNRKNNNFDSCIKLEFPEKNKLIDKIGYIEMDYNGYILTSPLDKFIYLIDYEDKKITKKEIDTPAYSADKIFLMQEEDESTDPDYTISYIYCKDSTILNECYLMMKNFEADLEMLEENASMKPSIRIHYNSQLNCYKDEQKYIRCTYTKYDEKESNYKHMLGIITSGSYTLKNEYILENNYDLEPTFDSMIKLKNGVFIIAYSASDNKNIIKIYLKKIIDNEDYIPEIPNIILNEDGLYKFEGGKASTNSLVRISYEKFALLLNNFKNTNNNDLSSEFVIFILTIYNSYSKINIRHYNINLGLYNTFINGKIIGYNYNGFLGALIELTSPQNKDLKRPAFLTFGYSNSTKDIDPMEGNDILIVKKQKIKISDYLNTIENNIFGYDITAIKVISVPDEKKAGQFTLNGQYGILKPNNIISINSEISFIISDNPRTGNYSIIFAPIIKEPIYTQMNSYCQKIETYPKNEQDTENNFYIPGEFLGKYFTFNFYIKGGMDCYQNCETCYLESKDVQNQHCNKCLDGYYKVYKTDNCFMSLSSEYYFDKNIGLFMPCYKDCLSCNENGTELKMNCLTCDDDKFDFYKKSSNCLDCPKYVDYNQTKCINELPEGYFVDNEYLGTIEKCHDLCKTCEKKPTEENGEIHMNCKTCKFRDDYLKLIPGNCPETEGKHKNNLIWIFTISIIIVIILIIVGVIICKYKCSNNRPEDEDNFYYNKKGKNISLEEEALYPQ